MKDVKQATPPLTVEDYIQLELQSERRHEYINGQLIEIPGEKAINNKIAGRIYVFLIQQLGLKGYDVFINDVKVASHDHMKYFYPDVFATKDAEAETNAYIKYEPELIVEVISPSSHITDTVDKYIAYTQIPSLKYYLIVQPETAYVSVYCKNADGKWEVVTYVRNSDVVSLPLLELQLPLAEVYGSQD